MRSRRLLEDLDHLEPPRERSFWQLVPRRNLRRALLLIVAIVAVLAIKHTGGMSLNRVFDRVAPAVPTQTQTPAPRGAFQHLEVHPRPPGTQQK